MHLETVIKYMQLLQREYMPTDAQLETFMRESNAIEGEYETNGSLSSSDQQMIGRLNPGDIKACNTFIDRDKIVEGSIQFLHGMLGGHLNEAWVGVYRTVNVSVGGRACPDWETVPKLMGKFVKDWPKLDSWRAHNQFEAIHPFQDLNGRTGRILWLVKALQEGYRCDIPFLHKYYYQTLAHSK